MNFKWEDCGERWSICRLGKLYVGKASLQSALDGSPQRWIAHVSHDDDGETLSHHEMFGEAQAAVEAWAIDAIEASFVCRTS